MCGIVGFIDAQVNESIAEERLERMMKKVSHRGPDGSGKIIFKKDHWLIALGHQRLSIIDIQGGAQPFATHNKSHWMTYNGELYNYLELKELQLKNGIPFKSKSDTEVLLNQWALEGKACLPKLNGMFAFAVWDDLKQSLTLARDRVGIKPLYYAPLAHGGIAFASELSALLECVLKKEINGLSQYFFLDYIYSPHTILKNIYKLTPGTFLEWSRGAFSKEKSFWSIPLEKKDFKEADILPVLNQKFQNAVQRQMISDVPLGIFLSGGIDSSLITAFATKNSKESLKTFSISFEQNDFDESKYAKIVSKQFKTEHFIYPVTEQILVENLDPALNSLDEPLGDPSILPTYYLSQKAANQVKVVLGGDGADELWGGYPTYLAHLLANPLGAFLNHLMFTPLIESLPVRHGYQNLTWKIKRFFLRWDKDPLFRHLNWMSNTEYKLLKKLLPSLDLIQDSTIFNSNQFLEDFKKRDSINRYLDLDFKTYLSHSVLTKLDRASMKNSLEVRPIFLDNELIEFALQMPSQYKIDFFKSKKPLRKLASQFLPSKVVNRKKHGFAIPLAKWMCGPLTQRLNSILNQSPLWDLKLIDASIYKNCLEEHLLYKQDHSKTLWNFIVLDHWMKRYF